ncbi:MAG: restriction endonuclease subunit S [Halieaceae bacterium]|jgi:type I restriction enzyme S subunit|nr:restriction endonuclease subunit S [Halieaceae bacterium]
MHNAVEIPAGYKQTEVGVIPEDWDADKLYRFWDVTDCKHVTALFVPQGFPVASIREVQNRFVDLTNAKQTNAFFYNLLIEGGRKPCPGDLIISRNATVGEVAQVADWHPAFAMGQDVCLLRRRQDNYSTEFFQAVFQSPIILKQLANLMVGSTFKRVNVQQIRNFAVPMPPAHEQHAIAIALSDVDTLLAKLNQLIAKKRDIKQAAMQELLTGRTRLPGFSGEWEARQLGEVAHIKTGSRNNEDKIQDGEYPFFVRSENIERINSYSYDCEAILIPGEGRIGEIFHYINGRFDVHQRVYAITQFKPSVSAKFVHLYMTMNFGTWAMQNTVKATVDSLRLPTFQTFEMRIPATKDEQTAIAIVLSDMDAEIAALEARRDKTRALKQGMMQELLTGRTRLQTSQSIDESRVTE